MTRGPGRHSEQNFRASEQHYNAAERRQTLKEEMSLSLCRHDVTRYWTDLTAEIVQKI